MPVEVKIFGTHFVTGMPMVCTTILDADQFNVIYSLDKSITNLQVLKGDTPVAYFPHGQWLSAVIKENNA